MVRSALITTTKTTDSTNGAILDSGGVGSATPLAAGAGMVLPALAMEPGLVYDAGTHDYVDFLCSLNYTSKQIRQFVPELTKCRRALVGGAANLKYPTLVVVFDGHTCVRTLTRTVTKVSEEPETYNVTVAVREGVKVSVTPTSLVLKRQNEKKSYTVEFRSEAVKPDARSMGVRSHHLGVSRSQGAKPSWLNVEGTIDCTVRTSTVGGR